MKNGQTSVMRRDRYSRWWPDAKKKSLVSSDSKLIGMQTGMNLKTLPVLDQMLRDVRGGEGLIASASTIASCPIGAASAIAFT